MGRSGRKQSLASGPRGHWSESHPDRHLWTEAQRVHAQMQTQEEYEALYGRGTLVQQESGASQVANILCHAERKGMDDRWQEYFQEAGLDRFIDPALHYYFANLGKSRFSNLQSPDCQKELTELLENCSRRKSSLYEIQIKSLERVLWRIQQFFKNPPRDAGSRALESVRDAERAIQEAESELRTVGEISDKTSQALQTLAYKIANQGPSVIPYKATADQHLYRAANAALLAAITLCYQWNETSSPAGHLSLFEIHMNLQEPDYRHPPGKLAEPIDSGRALAAYWQIFCRALAERKP